MNESLDAAIAFGETIIARRKSFGLPPDMEPPFSVFADCHRSFLDKSRAAKSAEAAREEQIERVAVADVGLDRAVIAFGLSLALAGLGPRSNPFKAFSKYSPSALIKLGFAREADEAGKLVAEVLKKSPPPEVSKAAAEVLERISEVTQAIQGLAAPQADYDKLMLQRDDAWLARAVALRKLKLHGKIAWAEDKATYEAFFAPAEGLQAAPKRKVTKKKDPKPAPEKVPA